MRKKLRINHRCKKTKHLFIVLFGMALPIPNYTLVGALYCILIVSWTCLSIATANGITGNIPYGLGILSKLTYLDLSSNDIKGTISRRFIGFLFQFYVRFHLTFVLQQPHHPFPFLLFLSSQTK